MLGLTKEERQALICISAIILFGIGMRFLMREHVSIKPVVAQAISNIGKVDINHCDQKALVSVRGIGDKLAGHIFNYRLSHGRFDSLEELRQVPGVTAYRYEKIKQYLYLSD